MMNPTSEVQTTKTTPRDRGQKQPGEALGPGKPSRLWLWVVAVFVLQLAVWTAWIVIASKNRVQEVPLVTAE